jgi:signal transduction histidine kinase
MNILINSLEAMPNGGTLTISAVEDTDQGIMHLTIADSGSGIAEDVQAKVFDPYFSTKETGIGLGLAITKKTIEDHGGKITLKSMVNQGTTICVELPLASEPAPVSAA